MSNKRTFLRQTDVGEKARDLMKPGRPAEKKKDPTTGKMVVVVPGVRRVSWLDALRKLLGRPAADLSPLAPTKAERKAARRPLPRQPVHHVPKYRAKPRPAHPRRDRQEARKAAAKASRKTAKAA